MSLPTPFYDEGGITIYHGDCREILPLLSGVSLVLTDPPYGITQNAWDVAPNLSEWWADVKQVADGGAVITASQPFTAQVVVSNPGDFKYEIIWEKSHPSGHLNAKVMPLRQHENILVFDFGNLPYSPQMHRRRAEDIRPDTQGPNTSPNYGRYETGGGRRTVAPEEGFPRSVVKFPNDIGRRGLHPTQKPLELFQYLTATYSRRGDTVLDCFAGSGTTLVAAKNLGRKAIGIEASEDYCRTAAQRLSQGVLLPC